MKKILITGCAGFIGFHLSKYLQNKYEVHGIDNLNSYYDKNLKIHRLNQIKKNINFHQLDLTHKNKMKNLFIKNNFDYVIHLAAQAGVRYSFIKPDTYIKNNIQATLNLLEFIKDQDLKHFIFSSTSSIYGYSSKKKPLKESLSANEQISLYSSTKKSCESIIHNYSYNFNIPSTILRFFTVYGPWGRPDMSLYKFVKNISKDQPIDVYNDGKMWRDFTYIDDLVISISKLINNIPIQKNKIKNDSMSTIAPLRYVNIGNQKSINLKNFIKTLEKIMEKKAKINYLSMQPGDVPFTLSESSLLKHLTNFTPNTSIEKGIKNFYDWYKNFYLKN